MITTIILFVVGAFVGWFISDELKRRKELRAYRASIARMDELQRIADEEEARYRSLKSGGKNG